MPSHGQIDLHLCGLDESITNSSSSNSGSEYGGSNHNGNNNNNNNNGHGICLSEDEELLNTITNRREMISINKFRIPTPTNYNNNHFNNIHVERYESLPVRHVHESFIRAAMENILNLAVFNATDRSNRVLEWHNPEHLESILDLNLKNDSDSDETLLKLIDDTIKYSVKTGHPYFVNQLFSGLDPYALIGQWLTDALNPSVYTYEVSPVFTLMEEIVLKEMRKIIGYSSPSSSSSSSSSSAFDNDNDDNNNNGDGIFCPGGSIANGYAINCARFKFMPDIKAKGLSGLPRLVLFTSEDSHYSVQKLAAFTGIGSDNVYKINTDSRGKLCIKHLENEILRAKNEGAQPFMVSATAGTTVLGAFDPLDDIANLCEKYNLWMHVDAAWGGGALMSQKYRSLLKGIERSDSVTWNPHKLLAVPQQCSAFLTKHNGILSKCHSSNATYLFQKDKFYDTKYDTGDKHIQCGRRADVFKFWFMWRAKGTHGLEQHINRVFENAEYFTEQIKLNRHFEMVLTEPECTNVCFWYIPPSLMNVSNRDDVDFIQKLHKVAPKIKERMMKEGTMMVTYQPLGSKPNFFRLVMQNSTLTKDDMLHFIDEFERLGEDL